MTSHPFLWTRAMWKKQERNFLHITWTLNVLKINRWVYGHIKTTKSHIICCATFVELDHASVSSMMDLLIAVFYKPLLTYIMFPVHFSLGRGCTASSDQTEVDWITISSISLDLPSNYGLYLFLTNVTENIWKVYWYINLNKYFTFYILTAVYYQNIVVLNGNVQFG